MGGTSSSKTFSILQLLLLIARKHNGLSISVVSETLPHLKQGAMKDFETIIKTEGLYQQRQHNKTDNKYFIRDSYIHFFSADEPGKVTGPRRDVLYLNECNNIPFAAVEPMEIRTNDTIFYDFNPVQDFWITEKVLMLPENEFLLIKSNYLDNDELHPNIKRDIELKASRNPNFKKIHVDVEFGISEGLIFNNWKLCDSMPETNKQIHGMDFGFSNDPTTWIDIRLQGGELWIDQLLYRTAMTNSDIIKFGKSENLTGKRTVADSAEPKSVEEIGRAGFNIVGAAKGKDSVNHGINLIKQYPVNITKRSLETIKEFRNYKWKQDKLGNFINEPITMFDHSIDAIRYACEELLNDKIIKPGKYSF